ncbi:MAG: hypothetical protein HY815_29320, partial [Candidatus Riflebacteria bacterium]|nr:hypothetical protein [Candidatus Riflebacteria bacterium]
MRSILRLVLPLLLATLVRAAPGAGPARWVEVGQFQVGIRSDPFSLEVRSGSGKTLIGHRDGLTFCRVGQARETVRTAFGLFAFDEERIWSLSAGTVTATTPVDGAVSLSVTLGGPSRAGSAPEGQLSVKLSSGSAGVLTISLEAGVTGANRLSIAFPSPPDESFLGFGEQYNRVKSDGRRVPIWVSEQGIGRSDGPIHLPFSGTTSDTYFPMPWYLSTRGYGFLLDSFARSVFDLRLQPRTDRVTVEVWDRRATIRLVDGDSPARILERLTAHVGRPRQLPDWAFGTWLGVQGGPARLKQMLAAVRDAGGPVAAVWAQDWVGCRTNPLGYDLKYHWLEDPTLYPDLAGLIADLHRQGIRFLGYFNTFVEPLFPEYAEGEAKGHLVRDAAGKVYAPRISTHPAALVDLSSEPAREWLGSFLKRALRMGMDGWMADFGEWVPFSGRIASPEGTALFHNRYPVEWARLNRESGLAERPDGDFVIFARSGFVGSARWLDMVWGGDQNTSWGDDDGLPTVVPAGLSLGLSGIGIFHFDAGGYTSLISLPRGAELFMRWVEAAALSPVLRT